jgi:hypothetical protein
MFVGVYAPSMAMSRELNVYKAALQVMTVSNLNALESNYQTLGVTGRCVRPSIVQYAAAVFA